MNRSIVVVVMVTLFLEFYLTKWSNDSKFFTFIIYLQERTRSKDHDSNGSQNSPGNVSRTLNAL